VIPCVPGAEISEIVNETTYKAKISVKIGPILTNFTGEVKILRMNDETYELEMEGKGKDIRGAGSASMKMKGSLRKVSDGVTDILGNSQFSISGRFAQFGSRMMEDISNLMFEQFTSNLTQRILKGEDEEIERKESEPIKALPLALSAAGKSIQRMFRRVTGRSAD